MANINIEWEVKQENYKSLQNTNVFLYFGEDELSPFAFKLFWRINQ